MSELERSVLQYVADRSGQVSFEHLFERFAESGADVATMVQEFMDRGWFGEGKMLDAMPSLVVTPNGAAALKRS